MKKVIIGNKTFEFQDKTTHYSLCPCGCMAVREHFVVEQIVYEWDDYQRVFKKLSALWNNEDILTPIKEIKKKKILEIY